MIRVAGIEPALHAWEARVLPLNDTRVVFRVDEAQSIISAGRCQGKRTAAFANVDRKIKYNSFLAQKKGARKSTFDVRLKSSRAGRGET